MDAPQTIISSTIELFKKLLFGDQCRAERIFASKAGPVVYICALRQLDAHQFINKIAASADTKTYIIDTEYLQGLYIEIPGAWILFYSPPDPKISLGVDTFNQSLDSAATQDLVAFGKNRNITNLVKIGFDVFLAMLETYYDIIGHTFSLSESQLNKIKLINTFKEFFNNYNKLIAGNPINFSRHVGSFSWIYYLEIHAIQSIIGNLPSIKIHDVATNTGNFPLLLSQLAGLNLLPFRTNEICCSDYNDTMPARIFQTLQESLGTFQIPVRLEKLDVRAPSASLSEADVIIANDILEHFSDEEAEHIFHNLWAHTSNLLIIHVPIEETPNRFYGHFTNFTDEKLYHWADRLADCRNLTGEFLRSFNFVQMHDLSGFLFLKKITA
jgi:hypothetical protein